jgi:Ca2+-binding RTX toxin-like protein
MVGGAGDDALIGGGGDDRMYGGDGNDAFTVFEAGGSDIVQGGAGSWTDVINVQNAGGTGAPDADWTISIDGGTDVAVSSNAGFLDLGADRSGTITFDDGSEVSFDGIERIEW